jgi:HAE1 family hydrophobic/amphiphilic exporter-1
LAVVGGLLVSQLLTLYITPVYYVYIENARMWLAGRKRGTAEVAKRDVHGAPVEVPMAIQNIEGSRGRA